MVSWIDCDFSLVFYSARPSDSAGLTAEEEIVDEHLYISQLLPYAVAFP